MAQAAFTKKGDRDNLIAFFIYSNTNDYCAIKQSITCDPRISSSPSRRTPCRRTVLPLFALGNRLLIDRQMLRVHALH
jgi:hypothetical protein